VLSVSAEAPDQSAGVRYSKQRPTARGRIADTGAAGSSPPGPVAPALLLERRDR
jgi:hypothetical protein